MIGCPGGDAFLAAHYWAVLYRGERYRPTDYFLVEGPERPGEPEVEKPYSLKRVFEWLGSVRGKSNRR